MHWKCNRAVWETHTTNESSSWPEITCLIWQLLWLFCLWSKSYTLWITSDARWTNFLSWKPSLIAVPAINQVRSFHNIFLIYLYCNIFQILLTIDIKSIACMSSFGFSTIAFKLSVVNAKYAKLFNSHSQSTQLWPQSKPVMMSLNEVE